MEHGMHWDLRDSSNLDAIYTIRTKTTLMTQYIPNTNVIHHKTTLSLQCCVLPGNCNFSVLSDLHHVNPQFPLSLSLYLCHHLLSHKPNPQHKRKQEKRNMSNAHGCCKTGPGYASPLEAMSGPRESLIYVTAVYSGN